MLSFLEKLLPTKQTRIIATATWSLALSVPFLAEALQKLGLNIEYLSKPEVRIILGLLVFCLGLIFLVYSVVCSLNVHIENQKDNIKLKFGIYWDKDNNPLCPSCKLPVSFGKYVVGGTGYRCFSCKQTFPLTDDVGNRLKPEQAIQNL